MKMPSRGGAFDRSELDKHVDAIGDLATGASHAVGDLTLAANATQTVVTNRLCTAGTMIAYSPTSASAAAARPWTVSSENGQFTVGHDASAATDRTFHYELRRRG
jgi:hypothetical protein